MKSALHTSSAFITPFLTGTPFTTTRPTTTSRTKPLHHAKTLTFKMAAEERTRNTRNDVTPPPTTTTTPATNNNNNTTTPDFNFNAPSLDTTAFSDFLDTAQVKVDELKEKAMNLDTEQLSTESQTTFRTLIDNALAGEWLNRGELYGGIQLLFVLLLIRSPGFLDSFVGFLVGPVAMALGAVISAKGVWDLGRKQLSIWPAPVPDGELRTGGLYERIRHPVYAGLILSALGWSSATGSMERFAVTIAMTYFLTKKIGVEEKYLSETYRDYEEYKKEVPDRIIPKIW